MKVLLLVILLGVTVSTIENDTWCQYDDSGIFNCVALGLVSVPYVSSSYPVKKLYLSFNKLNTLQSDTFQYYPNLTELELSHNGISQIDMYTFRTLSNLEKVDISYNSLKYINPHWFSSNHKMESLTLEGNSLQPITSPVLISSSLSSLYLSDCYITEIESNAFLSLPNLHFLDLTNNKLGDLVLNNVTSLVSLQLAENNLKCTCKIYSDSERGKVINCVYTYYRSPQEEVLINEICEADTYDDSDYINEYEYEYDSSVEHNTTKFIFDDDDSGNNNSSVSPALSTSHNTYDIENISQSEFDDSDESHDYSINTLYDILDMLNNENVSFASSSTSDFDAKIILNDTFIVQNDNNDSDYVLHNDSYVEDFKNIETSDSSYDLGRDIDVNYKDNSFSDVADDSDVQNLNTYGNSDFDGNNIPDDFYSDDDETREENVPRPSFQSYLNILYLFISLILTCIFSVVVFISVLVVQYITNKCFPSTRQVMISIVSVQANEKSMEKSESKTLLLQDA